MKSAIAVTLLVLGFCTLTASAAQVSYCLGQFDSTKIGSPSCVSYCCLCQLVKDAAAAYTPVGSLFYGQTDNKVAAINALFAQLQQGIGASSCFDPCAICLQGQKVALPFRVPTRPRPVAPQPEPVVDPSLTIPSAKYIYEAERKE